MQGQKRCVGLHTSWWPPSHLDLLICGYRDLDIFTRAGRESGRLILALIKPSPLCVLLLLAQRRAGCGTHEWLATLGITEGIGFKAANAVVIHLNLERDESALMQNQHTTPYQIM